MDKIIVTKENNDLKSQAILEMKRKHETQVPILRGCGASRKGGCFCTGACKEIIGWRDKHPSEY